MEGTQTVETHFLDKLVGFIEKRFRFTGVADDQCGTQCDIRHFVADRVDQRFGFFAGNTAAHEFQHFRRARLQRHVEVFGDVAALVHYVQDIHREARRIGILQTDPVDALHIGKLAH
ncbi:hypothetical protein D3C87_1636570 [compost metagenome]